MILYEFTITTAPNYTQQELEQFLKEILAKQSDIRGWALGFECRLVSSGILPDGSKQNHFQVIGQHLVDEF